MEPKPIKTEAEYESLLERVDILFDQKVKPGSKEGAELQTMLELIKQYEDEHYVVG